MRLRDLGATLYLGLALILLFLFIYTTIYPMPVLSRHAAVRPVHTIPPIRISGNADLTPPGSASGCKCAMLVNGTWVIGPWSINAAPWDGVVIDGVTVPFVLRNMTITNSGGAGIHLKNIHPFYKSIAMSGGQTSIQNNLVGILVESSSNLILEGVGSSPGSTSVNANRSGAVILENSSSITVKELQVDTPGDSLRAFLGAMIVTVVWAIVEIAGIALLVGILIAIPGINAKKLSEYFVRLGPHRISS